MRKLFIALAFALLLMALSVAPALADGGPCCWS